MFHTILFPTDGSELSNHAIDTVIQFARLNQARIVSIYVIQPLPMPTLGDSGVALDAGQFENQLEEAGKKALEKVATAARAAEVPFEGVITLSPSPYEEIVAAAGKHQCDIIVIASHGRSGLNRFFLGSESDKVLTHTSLPVLVLR
ncbi:universal stress protein [Oxalobacteraceae bacterium A2-2]